MDERRKNEQQELKERVLDVLQKLKGNRSYRQMSVDAGVSYGYLHDVMTGRYFPSMKILRCLSDESANPQNGITLEDLMVAAGIQEERISDSLLKADYILQKEAVPYLLEKSNADWINYRKRFLRYVNGCVLDSMSEQNLRCFPVRKSGVTKTADVIYDVDSTKTKEWWIKVLLTEIDTDDSARLQEVEFQRVLVKWTLMAPSSKRKMSVVTDSRRLFNRLAGLVGEVSYRGDLSVIMINNDTDDVLERYLCHYDESDDGKNDFYIGG